MRKSLSDKGVEALKPRAKRYAFPDPELRGMYIRVQPTGKKSFLAVALSPRGRQVWATIGACDVLKIDEARTRAREAIQRIKDGLPAFEAPPAQAETFEDVAEQWLKRHVRKKKLRSEAEIVRLLKVHVYPVWKGRAFLSIRRSDVAALLDEIQDDHGARQADVVLAVVRGVMNWYATRNDGYSAPIVRGMRRQSAAEHARERILDDEEMRTVWKAAEDAGTFGAVVRILLLTAQRRQKVTAMRWDEISTDGVWTIPTESREKGNAGQIALPSLALDIINAQPRLSDFVFAGRGDGPINSFSKSKANFDKRLHGLAPWAIHDLRRTARSLMARAGVRPDVAERVLGHVQAGVLGTYDRHRYFDEKADAPQRLATLVDGIVRPQDNVLVLPKRK